MTACCGIAVRLNHCSTERAAEKAPDGDAYVEGADFSGFRIPSCKSCGGMLKPDVVFFGEGVPKARVEAGRAYRPYFLLQKKKVQGKLTTLADVDAAEDAS